MTPLQAIRKRCLDCSYGIHGEVNNCELEHCELYPYRFGKKPARKKGVRNKTSLQSCRAYCLRCCLGSKKEVSLCPVKDCALYEFRLGSNPNREMVGEAKEKQIKNIEK